MRTQKGFSLVELIVVLAIIGTLAAIAIPAYSQYRLRANRSEARTSLLEAAQNLERFFVRNNGYDTATIGSVAGGDTIELNSPHGLYQLQWAAGPNSANYILKAVAQGGQVGDTACTTMTINEKGVKAPTDCW